MHTELAAARARLAQWVVAARGPSLRKRALWVGFGVGVVLFVAASVSPAPPEPVMVWRLRHAGELPRHLVESLHFRLWQLLGIGRWLVAPVAGVLLAQRHGRLGGIAPLRLGLLLAWGVLQTLATGAILTLAGASPTFSGGRIGDGLVGLLSLLGGELLAGLIVCLSAVGLGSVALRVDVPAFAARSLSAWVRATRAMDSWGREAWSFVGRRILPAAWHASAEGARRFAGALRHELSDVVIPPATTDPGRVETDAAPREDRAPGATLVGPIPGSLSEASPGAKAPAQQLIETIARQRWLRERLADRAVDGETREALAQAVGRIGEPDESWLDARLEAARAVAIVDPSPPPEAA